MRIAIDAVGRVVIPKPLREELGLHGPAELECSAGDGVLQLTVVDAPARVEEHDGFPVIVPEHEMQPMSVADVRAAVERTRR